MPEMKNNTISSTA